ncbi:FAR1 DNA-binding domain protein, partial [Medicago truncatula]
RVVAFKFYNMYGCVHGFACRRSRVVKNKDRDVIQQAFVYHREGLWDARNVNNHERKREHKPTSRCGCMAKIQVHVD